MTVSATMHTSRHFVDPRPQLLRKRLRRDVAFLAERVSRFEPGTHVIAIEVDAAGNMTWACMDVSRNMENAGSD